MDLSSVTALIPHRKTPSARCRASKREWAVFFYFRNILKTTCPILPVRRNTLHTLHTVHKEGPPCRHLPVFQTRRRDRFGGSNPSSIKTIIFHLFSFSKKPVLFSRTQKQSYRYREDQAVKGE